jgi:hypothetical protein
MDDDAEEAAPEVIRGHIRKVGYYRVSHGLFRVVSGEDDPDEEFRRDLTAWRLVLPKDAAFTSLTAARIRGWQLPSLPEHVPIFASVEGKQRPRRPGMVCSRVKRTRPPKLVHGFPVEPAEETLLRAARDLGTLDLLIMVDSARHHRHVDEAAMEALLAGNRPGVRNLRLAWRLSTPKAESAGESILRLFDVTMEVSVEPQAELFDEAGNLVGLADLGVTGTRLIHEYDGAHHREGPQQRIDLRRDRGLSRAGYQRRGVSLDDLLNHPGVLMHEVDRDLERPHLPDRLTAWRVLVANSLYSEVGRRRVLNRWQRQMGVIDWPRTASKGS